MKQRFIVLLSLIIFLMRCSDQKDTIVFVGDSMNNDNGVEQQYKFTSLLEKQLKSFGVVDHSKSDWTTNSFLENWNEIASDIPSGVKFIFVQLGVNDLKVYGHTESTISQCIANIRNIISRVKTSFPEAEIVLLSNTKIDYNSMTEEMRHEGFRQSTNQYLSQIAEGYSMISADNRCNFVDLHRQVPVNSTSDGFHLNKNGNKITASVINTFFRNFMLANSQEGKGNRMY